MSEADAARINWRALKTVRAWMWPKGEWGLRLRVLAVGAITVTAALLMVAAPLQLKALIDLLAAGHDPALALPVALIVAYPLMRGVSLSLQQVRIIVSAKVSQNARRQLSALALRRVHEQALRFHLDRRTGALTRVIERGASALDTLFRMTLYTLGPVVLDAVLVCIVLWHVVDPTLALIALGVVGAYGAVHVAVVRWQARLRARLNAHDNTANTLALDGLLNHETVKYFTAETFEAERYGAVLAERQDAAIRNQSAISLSNIGWYVVDGGAMIIVLVIAGGQALRGEISVGDFVLTQTYMQNLFIPLGALGFIYSDARQAFVDLGQLQDLIDERPEVRDRSGAPALRVDDGRVVFDRVAFGYDPRRPILRDISFEIPPGRSVAIVGASGAGKSTLARLLLRFYEAGEGAISIDGQDIRAVTQSSLRAAIGVVPQDTMLFNESLLFNIRYGRRDASREEVERATRLAHLDAFIASLPDGYDTQIGERGLKLSGGERQRMAIARVALKAPPILLFDEATSSLDSLNERAIQQNLAEISAGRTRLIIAHRLSTIADCDEILVLDQGAIAERGNHAALLRKGDRYAALWTKQQSNT